MAEFDPDAYLDGKKKKSTGFDPDAYLKKTQPETALQTFGRSAASLADTVLGLPGAAVREAAYNVGRFVGQPEQQAAQMADKFLWNDQVGKLTGVAGTPGYENAPLRSAGRVIGEGLQENVISPVASATGLPEGDVASMVNSAMIGLGPAVPKVAGTVGRGAVNTGKALVQTPIDVVKGAVGRGTGFIAEPGATPKGYQIPSSRVPLTETYYPAEGLAQLKQNPTMLPSELPPALGEQPIKNLAPGPVIALSGGEVPMAGKTAQAFGERIGETYRNPVTAAIDIGSFGLTGIPWYSTAKGGLAAAQGAADWMLGRKGFEALNVEQRAALAQGQNPWATGAVKPSDIPAPIRAAAAERIVPVQPQLGYSPTPTPQTIPMGGPGRRVNIEGESFTLPYEIDTSKIQPTGPRQATPQPTLAPVAPETIAPTPAPRAPATESMLGQKLTAEEILAQIQARSGNKGAGIFQTAGEAPPAPIDLGANRASFSDKINQHRAGLEETRAQNRETFSDTAENLGRGTEAERLARMTPAERADYFQRQSTRSEGMTDAAVVKDMIKITTNTGIRRYKNSNIVDNSVFDEFAADAGVLLDWKSAPDISKMGFAEGRTAMNDWMYKQIKTDANDLGLDTRTGGIRGQIKAMEEANKNIQPINPTEEAAAVKAAQERMKKLRGGSMEMMSAEPAHTFSSKQDFLEQQSFDVLAGVPTVGTYPQGNKIMHSQQIAPFMTKTHIFATDAKTGKRVPIGDDWTAADPKPSMVEMRETFKGVDAVPESTKIKRHQAEVEKKMGKPVEIDYAKINAEWQAKQAKKKKGK